LNSNLSVLGRSIITGDIITSNNLFVLSNTTLNSNLSVLGNIGINTTDLTSYKLNVGGILNASKISSNGILIDFNSYVTSNQLYGLAEKQYPPRIYDTYSNTYSTILNNTYSTEIIYINNGDYGAGTYNIYSSTINLLQDKKNLFNYVINDNYNGVWGNNYNGSTGIYNNLNNSTYIINDYKGDWIIIKLPLSIVLSRFRFYKYSSSISNNPSLWRCYGSTDGNTFTIINEATNDIISYSLNSNDYNNGYYEKIIPNTFNISYSYIAFVFYKIIGGSGSGTNIPLNFVELQIYGRDQTPSAIYITSLFNKNLLYYSTTGNDPNYLKISSSNTIDTIATFSNITKFNSNIGINTSDFNSYNLNINGTLNANSIYENGILLSNKYLLASGGSISGNINISSNLTVTSNLNVLSNIYLTSNLSVLGTSILTGDISAKNNLTVTSNLNVLSNINLTSNLSVLGTSILTGDISAKNNLTVTSNLNVLSNINLTSNLSVLGTSILMGNVNINSNLFINNSKINDTIILSNSLASSYTDIKFINNATSNAIIGIGGTNLTTLNSSYQNNFFIHSTCNIVLNANNNSTPANPNLFISTNGNIGIGTTNPTNLLHLYTTLTNNSFLIIDASGGTGQSGLKLLAGNGTTNKLTRIDFINIHTSSTIPRWSIINDYNENGTNDLQFINSSSTSSLTILQNGNIGINTNVSSSITYNLTINGTIGTLNNNIYIGSGTYNGGNINLTSANNDIISITNSSSSSSSYTNIKFNNNENSNSIIGIGGTNYTGYYKNNFFIQAQSNIILNANNTSNINPHLFISTSGNIGIGTSLNINSNLTINGSISADNMTLSGTLNAQIINNPNIVHKYGINFTCSTATTINSTTYYKYDINLTLYTKTLNLNSIPYRIFRIKIFNINLYFQNFTNNLPNILNYEIYMSNNSSGINICAIGSPENYNLSNILPTKNTLLRTNNFDYLSIISDTNNISYQAIIEDLLN
jgi:hypothetical protein